MASMKRQHLIIVIVGVAIIVTCLFTLVLLSDNPVEFEPVQYTYDVVNVYPHDQSAFTQGLVFEEDMLYEGTGLYGHSTLRRVDLETGIVAQIYDLPDQFFGEGITVFSGKIIQLTWKSGIGFIYDKNSFELLQEFEYSTEGWGITHNGSMLIMSDGTATLYFLDPETFQTISKIDVYDKDPVIMLNELEYIHGSVYANIWKEDKIVIINPQTGKVIGWIDLTGIRDLLDQEKIDVLNGIAFDQKGNRLFITGKWWSKIFEIEIIATN